MTQPRRIGLLGAVGIGAGAMLGAGVFAVWGPATALAGEYVVLAVAIAGAIAAVNALSTAQLASVHPVAGGAYTFGRRELTPTAGFVAGIGFVVGKTASIAAIALAVGLYAWPGQPQVAATMAIAAAWALNARGVARTAAVATGVAIAVAGALIVFVAAGLQESGGTAPELPDPGLAQPGAMGVVGAAALVFFAFAGYARIATLGEEVRDPSRTIPRAIGIALAAVLAIYLGVAVALVTVLGADELAASSAPVTDLVRGTAVPVGAVAVVAATAAFGSLVALMAGVGRTAMAMARESDLPRAFARQGVRGVPWAAEGLSALVAIALVWAGSLTFAIAMSSCSVLVYYAVANVAAHRSRGRGTVQELRVWPGVSMAGAVACVVLAAAVPLPALVAALAALGVSVIARRFVHRAESKRPGRSYSK